MESLEKIDWDDKFAIGVQEIDSQHKFFFSLLNELRSKVDLRDEDPQLLQRIIGEFYEYTQYHFQAEEAVMQECAYPHIREHKEQHQDFTNHLQSVYERALQGDFPLLKVIANYLSNWLINHILKSDTQIAEYLNQK